LIEIKLIAIPPVNSPTMITMSLRLLAQVPVTGSTSLACDLTAKQLQLFKELM